MIGEAPGRNEDVIGQAFVGPAGHEQDMITAKALEMAGRPGLRVYYANLILCIPLTDDNEKTTEPPEWAVAACKPRLEELVKIADPKLIVCLGKEAQSHLEPGLLASPKFHKDIPQYHCPHPASIIIMEPGDRIVVLRRVVAGLAAAIEKYVPEE